MGAEQGFTITENTSNIFLSLTERQEFNTSMKTVLARIKNIDGWETKPAELTVVYKNKKINLQALEIVKETRGFRILMSPLNGMVYKIATSPRINRTLEQELTGWEISSEVFELENTAQLVVVENTNSEDAIALEMPYCGVPIKHWKNFTSIEITKDKLDEFKKKMINMVYEHGIVPTDMNSGNVLVMMKNSEPQLVPIDWENCYFVRTKSPSERTDEAERVEEITQITLLPFYKQYEKRNSTQTYQVV